jgi:hypothetical protein
MSERVRVALILEPLRHEVPWDVRVRRALKSPLRSYGIRSRLFVEPVLGADASKSEPPF